MITKQNSPAYSLDLFLQTSQEFMSSYAIDKENKSPLESLLLYFSKDKKFEERNKYYSLNKGLLILGKVGTGKTMTMRIFQRLLLKAQNKTFAIKHINHITNDYIEIGHRVFDSLKNKDVLFDEVGLLQKEKLKHFGNQTNIFEELIMYRYDDFIQRGIVSHFTTNLSPKQIEEEYDPRIFSRLKEMCNFIVMTGEDKRGTTPPKTIITQAEEKKKDSREAEKEIAKDILLHYEKCQKENTYSECGYKNILSSVYYDFLDKRSLISYSVKEKNEALLEARKIIRTKSEPEDKNMLVFFLQSFIAGEIAVAKGLLYKNFIMNANVKQILTQIL